jgi:hypothetical protein
VTAKTDSGEPVTQQNIETALGHRHKTNQI